ncbi:acyl-CoA dehydrogenase [Paraburkholderia sp. USG1]|uniref:acyl-CoA dehydrogenase n=1 Tax=Paraburkholderia sp. USG1 TaxID=2952268 RepID=UPI002859CB75|nr:acyl-CoA dehydrogenase [Paraburkholderia sp. USG1]MDR8394723.1 acyl-CoA dehydrogenase [Paraburkholderia sp. USG1]
MSDIDIEHLRGWVGKSVTSEQNIEPFPARALAGLLDHEQTCRTGDALPLPWHWLYFLDTPSRAGTGTDGHPARGDFLPPVPLPRRMWAAGQLKVQSLLVTGQPARKVSTVRSVEHKEGKTGPLVFVQLAHELLQSGRLCIQEEQTLVYREAAIGPVALPPGEPAPAAAQWSRTVTPDPVLLFRFSALTYNGHRIHYDRDYAVHQEFYPALVVHGPLLATLLLDLLYSERPNAVVTDFRFRALRPTFDTDAFRLCGHLQGHTVQLWTVDSGGMVGMSARAVIT